MPDKRSILIVDDEPSVGDALNLILNDRGYKVVVALTGIEALAIAEKQHFDDAIVDIGLPDMSGLKVIAQLLKLHQGMRVVVITAFGAPDLSAEALRLGAIRVLRKPFAPAELLTVIDGSSNRS